MTDVTRPILRWHGGKWRLAPWIIRHFPAHRIYVEPFGGAASVLMRKPRAYAEVYNDLDAEVVNLFRVLQNPRKARRLVRALRLTPFAREEFLRAYDPARCGVERARRLIIRTFMGFGSDSGTGAYRTGFRADSNRSHTTPAHDWANYPDALDAIVERFARVVVERRPAIQIMRRHDAADTLHYIDPPYLPETRRRAARRPGKADMGVYRHELTAEDHVALLDALRALSGMVVLSGYPSSIYDAALPDWRRVERAAYADGASPRTECLWINPAAWAALEAERTQPGLFGSAA